MILIAHRGNINGRIEKLENEPAYINLAISKGYNVEIDVWYKNQILWLGHCEPIYKVDITWFKDKISKLWIHCKNAEAINFFNTCEYNFNYFWHETDAMTLTSLNYIWVYPGKQPIENSIAVMPEIENDDITKCMGICSDFIERYG